MKKRMISLLAALAFAVIALPAFAADTGPPVSSIFSYGITVTANIRTISVSPVIPGPILAGVLADPIVGPSHRRPFFLRSDRSLFRQVW